MDNSNSPVHNPCAVIPVYNHETAVPGVVAALRAAGLPCVLVDDASSPACAAVLGELARGENIFLIRLAVNQGKGGAVMAGLREAMQLGFTHALQVDADGQHDLRNVATFMRVSQQNPAALVCGYPQYDASVPKGRLYARYLTHVWVWINSLSLQIPDSMCGFRVYPLAPTQVHYPQDGLSHFRLFHDNALISSMHTKLFFGMLIRLPGILWRRCKA